MIVLVQQELIRISYKRFDEVIDEKLPTVIKMRAPTTKDV
jgi:hypothetical protein